MSTITYGSRNPVPLSIFYLPSEQPTHTVDAEKIVVDNTVHIDGDHNDILRVTLTNNDRDAMVVSNSAQNPAERFRISPNGALHLEGNVHCAGKVFATDDLGTSYDLLGTMEQKVSDLNLSISNLDTSLGQEIDDVADDVTVVQQILAAATHTDDGSDQLVQRSAANCTTINNLVCKADEVNRNVALYPPPGLLFDKGFCEASLDLLDNAQLNFIPYDSQGNAITGRQYRFGRDSNLNDDEDGVHLFDNTDPADTKHVRISLGESVPSLVLQGSKNANVPILDIRDATNATTFAVAPDGSIQHKGHLSGSAETEPSHHSMLVGDTSIYIGSMRLSYDRSGHEMTFAKLKHQVPVSLAGYSLPGGQSAADKTVHDWCVIARAFHSDPGLKPSEVFPTANADWDAYTLEATRNINTNISTYLTPMIAELDAAEADITAIDTRVTTLEAASYDQESYGAPTGSVTFTGNGNNQWRTTPSQGTRLSGSIDVNFNGSVSSGTWLSVFIRFDENVLLGAMVSYDITFDDEDFSSIGSMSDLDILFNAKKSNFTSSSWTDSNDNTYTDEDFVHIRFESTRTQNSNTPFKIAYRVIPTTHRLLY